MYIISISGMVSYTRQDTRTVFQTSSLPSLLFQHSTVSPQGGNRPLRGTDQKLHARKGVFFVPVLRGEIACKVRRCSAAVHEFCIRFKTYSLPALAY